MNPARHRLVPWLLGFFLTANLYLVPNLATSPRATDLVALLLAAWLLGRAHRRGVPAAPLAAIGLVNVMPVVWLGLGMLDGEVQTLTQAARWLLAAPWALALLVLTAEPEDRERFAWGIVIGCGLGVAVTAMQFVGLDALLRRVGLSTSDSTFYHYVYHQVRIPGLHGHHGASSAVISLLAPAGVYLYYRRRAPVWLPIACLLAMLLGLHLTSTRSPLVVSVLVVAAGMVLARDLPRSVVLGSLLVTGGLAYLAVFGPPGGAVRWQDMLALEANANERLVSNLAALELSVRNPLGLGVLAGRQQLVEASSIRATHNAFLQASLFFGAPLALLLLAGLLRQAARLLVGVSDGRFFAGLMALQVTGLFMFEEHLNNPTFIILVTWLVAAAVQRRLAPRPVEAPA